MAFPKAYSIFFIDCSCSKVEGIFRDVQLSRFFHLFFSLFDAEKMLDEQSRHRVDSSYYLLYMYTISSWAPQ